MCHKRKVLHQPTRLPFRRIARAQHAPLTRLQRTRPTDLPRLLELGRDARHHPQRRDEREATEDVRDSRTVHLEPLEGPVSCRNGAHEASSDVVALELHGGEGVKLGRARGLLQHLVNGRLQVRVERLEEVLEEQSEQLSSTSIKTSEHGSNSVDRRAYSSRRLFPT